MTSGGIDWQREKWQSGLGSKFIHQGEKNAAKYADEVIVLSKGVQDYGQPEKSLISCGFTRLDLFTSTCFCLSWCVAASVISGANGFWLRSILNPPQRKLIEQKTE